MKALVYTYENWDKQKVCFRGYVKTYRDSTVLIKTCPVVRNNKAAAERDAKKLLADIRDGKVTVDN